MSEEIKYPKDGSIIEGSDGKEKVVHDTNEDGEVIGWHKESV